jgi:transcription initiation factor TFIIF subunit beta
MEVEESENKPFDAEAAQDGEETQPDPDEHMITDTATGRVWIVKVREQASPTHPSLLTPPG